VNDVIAAMEANFAEHAAHPIRHARRGAVHDEPDLLVVDSATQSDMLNIVMRARFDREHADERIAAALGHFRGPRRPMTWWVGPGSAPTELGPMLLAHGLACVEESPGMILDLDCLPASPLDAGRRERGEADGEAYSRAALDGLRIQRVDSEVGMRDYSAVLADFGGVADPGVITTYREAVPGVFRDGAPARFFVGYLSDEPVATCELFLAHGVAGLYAVVTLEHARGRGIAGAMTLAALSDARGSGYRVAVLEASELGRPVYNRLGFTDACTFLAYQ